MNACLQPDDRLGVEQGFNLGLWNAEAQVGHEFLAGVGLDHPGEDGDVLLALQPAPDYLHQLQITYVGICTLIKFYAESERAHVRCQNYLIRHIKASG